MYKRVYLLYNQRKKSAHERAREHFASGEWATGQKWADDAPKEELDPDNVNLMNIGACGAFVHGTEDEFLGAEFFFTTIKIITEIYDGLILSFRF